MFGPQGNFFISEKQSTGHVKLNKFDAPTEEFISTELEFSKPPIPRFCFSIKPDFSLDIITGTPNIDITHLTMGPDQNNDGHEDLYLIQKQETAVGINGHATSEFCIQLINDFESSKFNFQRLHIYDVINHEFLKTTGISLPEDATQIAVGGMGDVVLFSDSNANAVGTINADTGEIIDVFVEANSDGLDNPTALEFGPDANGDGIKDLYVSSADTNEIKTYDGKTGEPISNLITGGLLDSPADLVFGPFDSLYVVNSPDQILRYNGITGDSLGLFANGGSLDDPKSMAFGPDGDLYVSNAENIVLSYDVSRDAIFVADWQNELITMLDFDSGNVIKEFDVSGLYGSPQDLAVEKMNEIVTFTVTDSKLGKLVLVDSDKGIKEKLMMPDSTDLGALSFKPGIEVDSLVFINASDRSVNQIDTFNNIKKIFTFDNTFEPNAITVNGSRLTLLDEQFVQMLMQPSDFAFDSDSGKIFVSDKNDQDVEIRRYTADDGILDSQLKKFKKTSDTRFEKQDIFSSTFGVTIPVDKACRVQTDKIFTANSMNIIPDVNGDGTDDLIIHLTEETFVDRTKIGVIFGFHLVIFLGHLFDGSAFSEIYNKINCPDEFSSSSSLMVLDGKTGNGISGKTKQVTQGTESDVIVGGPNNEVLLASNMGGFIERFDADNFESKGKINGLNKPDGLSFGPDANGDGKDDLYVSNSGNNTILHFDGVTYESLGAFVSPDTIVSDNLFSVVSAEIIRPTSLAFGPDKNLYVKTNTDVMVFQGPGGINPGSFVEGLGLSQSEEESLISIADLKFSPTNQNLYLLDSEKGQIDRYDGNGGNIFVADWDKKSIKELAPTGQLLGTIDFVANLNNPENIALDNVGKTFWITDSGDQKLVKLDADGMEKGIPIDVSNIISGAITSFAIERPDGTMDRRDNDGNLIGPQDEEIFSITPVGIDLDSINNIYISDWAKENLIILDEQGNFVDRFGLNGTLKDPIDLTINEVSDEVQIFVSENDTPEIVRINRDGLVQTVPANVELDGITQIEDDPNDRKFFLTDMSNPSSLERIQQLNLADEMPIPITDIFVDPVGIEIVENVGGDDFYIGDWKDLRIIKLDDDGDKTGLFVPDFYFQNPSDLVVDDPLGDRVNMWIADAKIGKVIKVFFIVEEQEREDLLDVDGRFIFISGVDLDTKGNFYVANVTDNSIRKFDDRANLQATEFFPQGFQLADNIWVSGKDEVYIPLSDPVPALWHLKSNLDKIELGLIGYGSKIGAPQFGETVSSGTANAVVADSQDNILIATTDGYLEKIKMVPGLTFNIPPFGPIDFFESDGVLKEPGSKLVRTDVVFNIFGIKFTIFTGFKTEFEECTAPNTVGNFCKRIGNVSTGSKFTDMATGVDDRLYVVDENLNRVHKYDLNGATLLDQMCSPRDLTFGRDLNLDDDRELLSTTCDGKIALYDGENGVLLQENFISDVLKDIKAITFGPDENLYVYNTNTEDEILIYNGESGDFIAKFSVFGAGMTSGKAPADILFGRDCDADDETTLDLYVSNGGTDRILCFQGPNSISPNTFIRDFVSTGSTLNVTSAIAFGPDRNDDGEKELYVASGDDDKIVVFDGVTGNPLPGDEFEFISKGEGGLDVASELVFDINEENLLVSSQNTDEVIQFNATDGQFIQNFNRGGEELLDGPNGLIFSPNDNTLFVASEANEHILRYAATGNFLEKFNKGIYMGWAGKCDSGPSCDGNNQVSKGFACTSDTCFFDFSAGGDPTAGTDDGQFKHPDHIDVDPVGNVFISDQPQENVPAQTAPNRVFACQSLSQVTFSTGRSFNYGFPQTICVDIIIDLVEREQARQNGIKFIQVCSQVVRGFCTDIPTEGSISMLQTMPRVQKLSNDGFFIVDAISDITKLELAGNFDVTRSIAVDRDRLYVADVKKLHFFDVNPFSSVLFDPETNVTSSFVTYSSNPSFVGFDDFEFLAFDGFDSSVGKINVTVNDPDLDRDGITLALDKNPTKFSDEFSDVPVNGVTSGVITERGGQVLTVRDESDPTKGVFILAGFFGTSPPANIELCGGSVKLHLVEGNSLIVRCEDPEINVIRGPVSVELFDVDNRIGTVMLQKDETLKFNPGDSVLGGSPANKNTINVDFSAGPLGSKIYPISPRDKRIFIDTELPKITCPSEITVGTFSPKGTPLKSVEITNAFAQIKVTDLKDPNPGIENAPLRKINDAPDFFNLGFAPTTVNFTGIDEIGNTSFCSTEVTVADLDDPIITPPPEITVETPLHSDVVVVDYEEGFAEDLFPNGAMVELETPSCNPAMGSLFGLGTSPITCTATDESGRVVTEVFEIITVVENPRGVIIESATATGKNLDGVFSDGDEIIVKFSQDTNRPDPTPSESGLSKSDIDTIFKISKGDDTPESLGTNYTGTYLTPSILAIEITNSTDGSPTPDDTKFTINPGANLKNAAQTIDGNTLESTTLTGSFATIQGPQIIALVASGDAVMGTEFMGNVYNNHTKILLKFSEPTNAPNGVGLIISKDKVDSLFSFKNGITPISLGTDYEGQWLTKSKFLVSLINKTNNGGPQIGNTTATVIGDIQNSAETSDLSESVSPPMFGSFGAFTLSKPIEDGGSFTITLPSGIDAEIKLPSGTSGALSLVKIENTTIRGSVNILGDMIDLSPRESSTCNSGCNILFTFTREDLKGTSFTPNTVTVLHDLDGNGRFDDEGEELTTIITEISPPGTFLANATVFSFSSIALGKQVVVSSGGGGGDNSSPVVTSASIIPDPTSPDGQTIEFGGRLLKLDEQTPFTNIVRTGESITVRLLLYDNQGVNAIRHVTLYTNLQGYGDGPEETGTYIRYVKGQPTKINDPTGIIQEATTTAIPRNGKLEVNFDIVFSGIMDKSKIIVRIWDVNRNGVEHRFHDAIHVIESESKITDIFTQTKDKSFMDEEPLLSYDLLKGWAGINPDYVTDSELLKHIGIQGDNIPQWFKESNVAKWVIDGEISQRDFINALEFLSKNKLE